MATFLYMLFPSLTTGIAGQVKFMSFFVWWKIQGWRVAMPMSGSISVRATLRQGHSYTEIL